MHRATVLRKRAYPVPAETDAEDQSALDRHHAPSRKATFSSERIIIPSHVHEQRRRVNQTVDPIQNSAVTGNSCSHVFGSDVALNHANRKIAQFPDNKCRDVSQPCRENNVANEAVGVASVSDKSEVTEHPADVNKTDYGERYASQLAASAIAQNRNEQDQRDRERRHGDKESVPARALFFAARIRN